MHIPSLVSGGYYLAIRQNGIRYVLLNDENTILIKGVYAYLTVSAQALATPIKAGVYIQALGSAEAAAVLLDVSTAPAINKDIPRSALPDG